MNKISASEKSDLTLIGSLFFLLLLYAAYNTHIEKRATEPQGGTNTVMKNESPCITQL